MVHLPKVVMQINGTGGLVHSSSAATEDLLAHNLTHSLNATTPFPLDFLERGTTAKLKLDWLGAHEVISITFVLLFVLISVLIGICYYTYKLSPCCRSCRKQKSALPSALPASAMPQNLSQVFVRPKDADRIERCDSEDSIRKL